MTTLCSCRPDAQGQLHRTQASLPDVCCRVQAAGGDHVPSGDTQGETALGPWCASFLPAPAGGRGAGDAGTGAVALGSSPAAAQASQELQDGEQSFKFLVPFLINSRE